MFKFKTTDSLALFPFFCRKARSRFSATIIDTICYTSSNVGGGAHAQLHHLYRRHALQDHRHHRPNRRLDRTGIRRLPAHSDVHRDGSQHLRGRNHDLQVAATLLASPSLTRTFFLALSKSYCGNYNNQERTDQPYLPPTRNS